MYGNLLCANIKSKNRKYYLIYNYCKLDSGEQ